MEQIWKNVRENKYVFLGTFFFVFTATYLVFLAVDFLPEEPTDEKATEMVKETEVMVNEVIATTTMEEVDQDLAIGVIDYAVLPTEIYIEKLDRTVPILNPASRTIADLDAALLEGVVRHPDSATLAQDGNVFVLGHSSYLPNVFNKNFQAFNGIQDLEWGDIIEVSSEDAVFEYRVEKVYRAQASDVTVPIAGDEKILTLATCNSFGSVDDRYIVEAKQVSVREL